MLLSFRLWMLHGNLPEFSEMDNPASFSRVFSTRLLTYSYLCAFNAWLVICPCTLSYDWQMGSIPLVESPYDPRNLATMALLATLVALAWRSLVAPHMRRDDCRRIAEKDGCIAEEVCGEPCPGRLLPLLLAVLPFLPASNLFVSVGFVVAERVLYIPRSFIV
ncbi:protein O-mannosyl-transferase TMTC1-like [Dermacentor silvarum]|uniref:protein O-mannosyl-transferase TMTC1-like n=1 Tax=Dermacentor silvarum TaxID=543639 RepID=UPI002100EB50|nr:protein O-mannosyl-transferase TMTC1-like [Dermacentor silvarum]